MDPVKYLTGTNEMVYLMLNLERPTSQKVSKILLQNCMKNQFSVYNVAALSNSEAFITHSIPNNKIGYILEKGIAIVTVLS